MTPHLRKNSSQRSYSDYSGLGVGKSSPPMVCLLPGPVAITKAVAAAFAEPLVYHRGEDFQPLFQRVRQRLSDLVGGKPTAIFVGSGTLANEAIAATLAAEHAAGLILTAGEFGDRLVRQAEGWALPARVLRWDWGQAWNLRQVEAVLQEQPGIRWIWGVHHETSTGVLNDLPGLIQLAKLYAVKVCVDCVSSIGTVPVDLSGVYLASGTSGKALGSYSGLAFVFGDPDAIARDRGSAQVPNYLDVLATLECPGPRFTIPSPLVRALDAALEPLITPSGRAARFERIRKLGSYLRHQLHAIGCQPMADDRVANPSIVTFRPPRGLTSAEFVERCRDYGFLIAGQSGYLAERNLVQIAIMGEVHQYEIERLFERL